MTTCPRCGQDNPAGFRFCGACGAALAPAPPAREERKRVSVLFCDLVGFTGRAEALDPEEVRALLQPYHRRVRQELERRGGTVEKFIGDAVVAVFGAPVAHEDDPERAVRAALAVRDAIAGAGDLHVRIAVTTGEALVALDARPDSGEGMVSGDVVNTASRLQAAAPVDGVLVDDATRRATERRIEYRDHPPVEAKGKADPIAVHEAAAVRSRLGVDVGEAAPNPLVGRALEVGLLSTAFDRVRQARRPQLVTLVGVPGIGKSRLVQELFRAIEADPELVRWRQGRCLPYGDGVTLWALAEIVKAEAGVLETHSAEEAAARLHGTVTGLLPDDATWAERHLRPLIGLEDASELTGDRRDEAFAAWRRWFEALADERPTVIVLEDLQWADDQLLDFVDHLLDWAAEVPLLVVATARPELLATRPNWGGGKANATNLSLHPLSDDETATLARDVLGQHLLAADVQQALLANAGGNPLYAEEFARLLTERGSHDRRAGLPESVQGIIAARLDGLDAPDKALLQDASVLGKVFWPSALAALAARERADIDRSLHELERRELVRRDRQSAVSGEQQYAFRHVLVREVAYGQIPRSRRSEKHAAAARWIEGLSPDRSEDRAEMLAHHWSAALDYATSEHDLSDAGPRARQAFIDAGDRAVRLNAPAEAAALFERAMALEPTPDLLLRHARSLFLSNDAHAEARLTEARDALAASGDRAGEAFSLAMLSQLAWVTGRPAESWELMRRAVDLVTSLPASEIKAFVLSRAASRAAVAGQTGEAIEFARAALDIARPANLAEIEVNALTSLGQARHEQGDDGGLEDLERAVSLGREIKSREVGRAAHNAGVTAFFQGDIARFAELTSEALEWELRLGDHRMAWFTESSRVSINYMVGDWNAAERGAAAFFDAMAGTSHYMEPHARAFRALITFSQGDADKAIAEALRALDAIGPEADPQARAAPMAAAAFMLLEVGHPRGEAVALDVLGVRFGRHPEFVASALLSSRRVSESVARALEAAVSDATESRWVAGVRASLAGRFADAADIWASMPFRPAEALARMRAAEALLEQGRRAEADAQLRRAVDFWRSVGAMRYLGEAERLLPATA